MCRWDAADVSALEKRARELEAKLPELEARLAARDREVEDLLDDRQRKLDQAKELASRYHDIETQLEHVRARADRGDAAVAELEAAKAAAADDVAAAAALACLLYTSPSPRD